LKVAMTTPLFSELDLMISLHPIGASVLDLEVYQKIALTRV
jgi:hypothetical protein